MHIGHDHSSSGLLKVKGQNAVVVIPSKDSVAICHVLPVLWMTSCLVVISCMAYCNTAVEFDFCECLGAVL